MTSDKLSPAAYQPALSTKVLGALRFNWAMPASREPVHAFTFRTILATQLSRCPRGS